MINKKRTLYTIVILLAFVFSCALGYITFNKKIPVSAPTPLKPVSSVSSETHTISLKNIPITLELPRGYAIFQRDGFEGGHTTIVTIGKEISTGHFEYAPLGIEFQTFVYDARNETEYSPQEYVDVVFNEQKEDSFSNPRYTELLGNKAVIYTNAADDSVSIVGYIRADQIPELSQEFHVQISSFTYGSGVDSNKELFDTVVDSLRIGN